MSTISERWRAYALNKKAEIKQPTKIIGATWITLSKNKFALVDDCDAEATHELTWYAFNPKPGKDLWYAANKTRTNYVTLHRFIARRMGLPVEDKVDHEDHNGLNCRRINLRTADSTQNQGNTRLYKTNCSGYKGVSLTRKQYWRARIFYKGKETFIGHFPTARAAAIAYDEAATEMFKEYAMTNKALGLL